MFHFYTSCKHQWTKGFLTFSRSIEMELWAKMGYSRNAIQNNMCSLWNTASSSIISIFRSSHPEVFFGRGVLKIYSKLAGERPCRSVISIKLLCNFTEITLRHGCSPKNLLNIFRTPFSKNTSAWLLLNIKKSAKRSSFFTTPFTPMRD